MLAILLIKNQPINGKQIVQHLLRSPKWQCLKIKKIIPERYNNQLFNLRKLYNKI